MANWQLILEGSQGEPASTRLATSSGLPSGPGSDTQVHETRRNGQSWDTLYMGILRDEWEKSQAKDGKQGYEHQTFPR